MDTLLNNNTMVTGERTKWRTIALLVLAFWLSSSLFMDLLMMPGLYAAGMLSQPEFVPAGYLVFGIFNRVELICAGAILTLLFVLRRFQDAMHRKGYGPIVLSALLLTIAVVYTYNLTPEMGALSLQLNLFEPRVAMPPAMIPLQGSYWGLELVKVAACGLLLKFCYSDRV